MAKATTGGRAAAKKSSKKSKKGKNKTAKTGTVEGRPIIIKGGALPGDEENTLTDYILLVEANVPTDCTFNPGQLYPYRTTYPTLSTEVASLQVVVDGVQEEIKVEGTTWSITLVTP